MQKNTTQGLLLCEKDARGVYTLTLNDPGRFNALGSELLEQLRQQLGRIGNDGQARAVVLAGNGKAFCAGHNLKDMAANPSRAWYEALFAQCTDVMLGIRQLPVPVIAKVQGIATAAGCQLVAQCDLAVAAKDARFATSGIQYGLFCSTPSVPLVRNIPIKHAMHMLLTGDFIDAPAAAALGLINHAVELDALDAAVEQLVASIVAKPGAAVRMGKALVYRQQEMELDQAYDLAARTMAENMMDANAQEGAQAFAQKRQPVWPEP